MQWLATCAVCISWNLDLRSWNSDRRCWIWDLMCWISYLDISDVESEISGSRSFALLSTVSPLGWRGKVERKAKSKMWKLSPCTFFFTSSFRTTASKNFYHLCPQSISVKNFLTFWEGWPAASAPIISFCPRKKPLIVIKLRYFLIKSLLPFSSTDSHLLCSKRRLFPFWLSPRIKGQRSLCLTIIIYHLW